MQNMQNILANLCGLHSKLAGFSIHFQAIFTGNVWKNSLILIENSIISEHISIRKCPGLRFDRE